MAVTVRSFIAAASATAEALADLDAQLAAADISPTFALIFYDACHDDAQIVDFVRAHLPGVPVIGGTSSQGLVGPDGISDAPPIGLLVVDDQLGYYGVAGGEAGDDPADAAERLLHSAMADAGASGELPELIITYLAPGVEESALLGLQRVVGDRCPIIGGTSIDNDVAGHWRQLGPEGITSSGISVAVLSPSGGVSLSFQGGYEPTESSGIVTEVSGSAPTGRAIVTIDGRRASEVYDEWNGNEAEPTTEGRVIAYETAHHPLGIEIGTAGGISYYRLIHLSRVGQGGTLETFADVAEGDRICLMRGSKDGLIRRAGTVVATAVSELSTSGSQVAGGLVIYCAGCRLAVGDRIDEVVTSLQRGFGDVPFLGLFTGGEQGPVLGRVLHSNLMISAITFGQ